MIAAFDTSILIDIQRNYQPTLNALRKLVYPDANPAYLPFTSYFEFYEGILEKSPKNFKKSYAFLQKFPTLHPTKQTAEILATLKKNNKKNGVDIPISDLLIAAQVKEHNLLLVTKDKDFKQIDDIKCIVL